jgi:hypothetical protein
MVDDDGRPFAQFLPIQQFPTGRRPFQECNSEQGEADVQLPLVAGAQAPHRPLQPGRGERGGAQGSPDQTLCSLHRIVTVVSRRPPFNTMNTKKFTKIIIWVVVISMVLALVVSVLAFI